MSLSRAVLVLSAIVLTLPAAAQETCTVETPKGSVSVPANPERIIVLNPQLAGSVYALGFEVMGVARTSRGATEEGFAAAWADIARQAGSEVIEWDFEGFNFEMLLSYEPDLIIAGGAGRPGYLANDSYEMLSDIAPTLFVDTALPNWQAELDYLAETLDRKAEEQAALDAYAIRIAEVREAITLPEQPTALMYMVEKDSAPYFVPEDSPTPQLFADVGFEIDPLATRYPDYERASTGDSVSVSHELAPEVFSAPTLIIFPWGPGSANSEDLAAHSTLSRIPAVQSGNVYDMPDYIYRFDYYGALATLDAIEDTFN